MKESIKELVQLKQSLSEIEKKIGYEFIRKELLIEAFIHRSIINEIQDIDTHFRPNERLEFLGDAVVNLYVASRLYHIYPEWQEGSLSQAKALLVSEKSLHEIVEKLRLHQYLVMGKGESRQHSCLLPSIQADLFEALIGAIYIDGHPNSMNIVSSVLDSLLQTDFFSAKILKEYINPKAELQELLAKSGHILPEYRLMKEDGPQHEKKFLFSVMLQDVHLGSGWGESKKEAQKEAAKEALEYIKKNGLPHFITKP